MSELILLNRLERWLDDYKQEVADEIQDGPEINVTRKAEELIELFKESKL